MWCLSGIKDTKMFLSDYDTGRTIVNDGYVPFVGYVDRTFRVFVDRYCYELLGLIDVGNGERSDLVTVVDRSRFTKKLDDWGICWLYQSKGVNLLELIDMLYDSGKLDVFNCEGFNLYLERKHIYYCFVFSKGFYAFYAKYRTLKGA